MGPRQRHPLLLRWLFPWFSNRVHCCRGRAIPPNQQPTVPTFCHWSCHQHPPSSGRRKALHPNQSHCPVQPRCLNTTSPLPSKARFRPDLNKTMTQLLTFLTKQNSPFLVDLNPYTTFRQRKNSSLDFALFHPTARPLADGHNTYKNGFDACIDSLVASLSALGFPDIDIVVGKIGWPTDGAVNATKRVAETFMKGLVEHLKSNSKTPLRPRKPVLDVYVFSLLDEDRRSVASGDYERHWGVFTFDGQAKYELDLGQGPQKKLSNAHDVEYLMQRWCVANNNNGDLSNASQSMNAACAVSDCTALSLGGSCAGVGWPGNASYAFNSYYQGHGQGVGTCDFGGLGMITTVDPSVDECRFTIGLRTSQSAGRLRGTATVFLVLTVVVVYSDELFFFFFFGSD
ncbi:Glucan endo-1,3-beta-glucosidase 9 [Acorus calamus]|uniref:Glucan endo-1,3-beta-glucosidase 9 n=1 Tax=Acorus calamus TaxID=4465 RepID=A0AAV9CBL8_ACOCL|nr:Glucan endo-1,3-beta-glucosidase 9 [Acorus calamus]